MELQEEESSWEPKVAELENERPRQEIYLQKLEEAYREEHLFLFLISYFLNTRTLNEMCKKDIQSKVLLPSFLQLPISLSGRKPPLTASQISNA